MEQSDIPYRSVGENHYYPFGMNMEGPWVEPITLDQDGEEVTDAEQLNDYQYNGSTKILGQSIQAKGNASIRPHPNTSQGMEYITDFDLNVHHAFYRTYDPAIGRFWQVDPLAEDYYNLTPYNGNGNDPIKYADPYGDGFIIGALIGGAVDYVAQVAVNYATGNENPWTDVDGKSIAASAAAGATGVGLIAKAGKVFNGRTLKAAEMAVDGTVNVAQQALTKGEVDFRETVGAVMVGQAVRSPVRDKIKDGGKGAVNKTEKAARTAERKAKNAASKSTRQGKINSKQADALMARTKAERTRSVVNAVATTSGAAASGAANKIKNAKIEENR